jgi:hypothetical protein
VTLETGRWQTRRDLPVWIALAALLLIGWILKGSVEGRTAGFTDPSGSLRVRYPAGWQAVPGSTALLDVRDPISGTAVPTGLTVTKQARVPNQNFDQIARTEILARTKQLDMYRVLSADPVKVAGKDAVEIQYVFVADPHGAVLELERIPVVVRGLELVVPADQTVYLIDMRADNAAFDAVRPDLDRIMNGIQL